MKFSAADIISKLPPFPDPAERYPPGSPEWSARVTVRAYSAIGQLRDYGAKRLVEVLRYALPHAPWLAFPEDHPLNDVNAYFEALCGMNWEGLLAVVRSVDSKAALELEAINADTQAKFRAQGTRTDLSQHADNISKFPHGGTDTTYLLRRLARERPDVLGRYKDGEFRSVRAAMKAAQLVIPRATIPSDMSLDALAAQMRRRFSAEQLAELIRLLQA